MSTIDAFHLPGLDDADVQRWLTSDAGDYTLRAPLLTPAGLLRCIDRLRSGRRALAQMPLTNIIGAVDRVAVRLQDAGDPLRVLLDAALPHLTGYSRAMTRLVVERMAQDWRREALERVVATELGGSAILDGFVERDSRQVMAIPPDLVTHIFAGNIPGVAVTSLVRALLVRAASLGKTASGEPLLAPLFAQAVAAAEPAIGNALAVTYWPGGEQALEEPAFAAADAVVVYGGADALRSVRRTAPAHVRVIDHGPRLSAGFVARSALNDTAAVARLAQDIARAVATFDQQGCVSPHAIFVEKGGAVTPRSLAAAVARQLAALQEELPRGYVTPGTAAAIRDVRARAEFGAGRELVSPADATFTVLHSEHPAFEGSCLQRTITVHAVDVLDDALALLAPHRRLLQSAALAGDDAFAGDDTFAGDDASAGDDPFAARLARAGFSRITSFLRIPWPDPAEHHDGRGPLVELLSFAERSR